MNTKLTLTIDKSIIVKAKELANESGQSLSGMIENYLKSLIAQKMTKEKENYSSLVNSLIGSVKLSEGYDYKEELTRALTKKYRK